METKLTQSQTKPKDPRNHNPPASFESYDGLHRIPDKSFILEELMNFNIIIKSKNTKQTKIKKIKSNTKY